MKPNKILIPLLLLFLLIVGCNVYKVVYYDYDHSVNFSKYKTFAWIPDKDTSKSEYNNEIIRNNARNYFSHCMAERCYKANIDTPDVFLELVITTIKKEKNYAGRIPPDYYYYHNPFYYPFPNPYFYAFPYNDDYDFSYVQQQVDYVEGSITLNVIDRKQKKLVWTGTSKGDLYDPKYMKENINPAIYSIIEKYPVKPQKYCNK